MSPQFEDELLVFACMHPWAIFGAVLLDYRIEGKMAFFSFAQILTKSNPVANLFELCVGHSRLQLLGMSKKRAHISVRIESFRGQRHDAHYLGYFDCFNRQLFYEAHDVLEELWLADRHGTDGDFYKGLIQLAGAFVHIQKHRRGPAQALFKLAGVNLEKYPHRHKDLELQVVTGLIAEWSARLETQSETLTLLATGSAPKLELNS